MAATSKILANCADWNGITNVLCMMKTDDYRLVKGYGGTEYTKIADGKHVPKERKFVTTSGETFRIFSDWSAKKI